MFRPVESPNCFGSSTDPNPSLRFRKSMRKIYQPTFFQIDLQSFLLLPQSEEWIYKKHNLPFLVMESEINC
jgi:hypothetical protein